MSTRTPLFQSWLLTASLLSLSVPLASAEVPGTTPDPPSLQGPPAWVQVSSQTECCPKGVVLKVQTEENPTERSIELAGRMQRLREIRLVFPPRVLLVGDLRYGGTNLWIANLEALKQEAEIWSYGYGISPSKRYLAYRSHYPPMALPDARRSIFLLYDLSLAPDENRSGPRSDLPAPKLGAPIFPQENVHEDSWSIYESDQEYSLNSPFLWSEDEQKIAFIAASDLQPTIGPTCYVVRIDLTEDGRVRNVAQAKLTSRNVESPHRSASVLETAEKEKPLCLVAEELSWAEEGKYDRIVANPGQASSLGPKIFITVP